MRRTILLFSLILLFNFCGNDDSHLNLSDRVSFEISDWILEDVEINLIDFDNKGNVWIASGSELIFYNGKGILKYNLDSLIPDLSVAPDGNVWLGTRNKD